MERLKVETSSEVKKKEKKIYFQTESIINNKEKSKEREISFPRFIFPLWIIEFAKSEFISEK